MIPTLHPESCYTVTSSLLWFCFMHGFQYSIWTLLEGQGSISHRQESVNTTQSDYASVPSVIPGDVLIWVRYCSRETLAILCGGAASSDIM